MGNSVGSWGLNKGRKKEITACYEGLNFQMLICSEIKGKKKFILDCSRLHVKVGD